MINGKDSAVSSEKVQSRLFVSTIDETEDFTGKKLREGTIIVEQPIAGGDTADIYDFPVLPGRPELVAKILRPGNKKLQYLAYMGEIADGLAELPVYAKAEYEALVKRFNAPNGDIYPNPGELIYGQDGLVIGYTMEKIHGRTLADWGEAALPRRIMEEFVRKSQSLANPETAHRDVYAVQFDYIAGKANERFDLNDIIVETVRDPSGWERPVRLRLIDPLPDYNAEQRELFDLSQFEREGLEKLLSLDSLFLVDKPFWE